MTFETQVAVMLHCTAAGGRSPSIRCGMAEADVREDFPGSGCSRLGCPGLPLG